MNNKIKVLSFVFYIYSVVKLLDFWHMKHFCYENVASNVQFSLTYNFVFTLKVFVFYFVLNSGECRPALSK